MRHSVLIGLITYVLLLTGCASGYSTYYKPMPGATAELISTLRVSPPPEKPIVEHASFDGGVDIINKYVKQGYVVIGQAMFNSGRRESDEAAIKQAKTVKADLVLILNPKYTGSVTTSVPITTPTTTTSYSTGNATAYGAGGIVNAYGSGTTTTYGSTTTYTPMTVNRADYGAVYFIKRKYKLGARCRDLNDSERKALQTNKGVVIEYVIDDTPAFEADLLVDDVITAIDGVSVSNVKSFYSLLHKRDGKMVALSIRRNGKPLEKSIKLAQ